MSVSTPSVRAASITVCAIGCDHTTIGAAISTAAPGDDIFIGPGTYTENITVNKNLKLIGVGANLVILQGSADTNVPYNGTTHSVVTIDGGVTVTISGVTIQGGNGNIYDDTIRHQARTTVPANAFDDRGRRIGGGIDNNGTLILSHCSVQNNIVMGENAQLGQVSQYSALGGGIYNANGAVLTIDHSTISSNSVSGGRGIQGGGGGGGFGGGIYNANGAVLTIDHSTISNNRAQGGNGFTSVGNGGAGAGLGGGLFNEGNLIITTSTFSGNDAIGGNGVNSSSTGATTGAPGGGFGGGSIGGFGGGGGVPSNGPGGTGGFGGGGTRGVGGGSSGPGGFGGGGGANGGVGGGVGGFGGGNGNAGGGGGAGIGGGIFINNGSNTTIDSSTIAGNNSIGGNGNNSSIFGAQGGGGFGGGIFSNGEVIAIDNSVLTGNTATSGTSSTSSVASVGPNCSIGNGSGGSIAGGSFIGSNNLVDNNAASDSCSVFTFDGTLAFPVLNDNGGPTQTHNPFGTSAIDTGGGCSLTDQRDIPRPQSGTCDRGAVEVTMTNNAPAVSLPLGTRNYNAGDGIIILESGAIVSDTENGDFDTLFINFQSGFVSGEDQLDLLNQGTSIEQIALLSIDGTDYVYYEGVVIGTYTATVSAINVTFNRNDKAATIQALMRVVTFENTSANPTAGTRTVAFTLTDSDGNSTTSTTDIVILASGYGSIPVVGSTINVGSIIIGNTINTTLTVQEIGNATLDVSVPGGGLFTGTNSGDFNIVNGPPFSIADGGADQVVTIQCAPSAIGLRTATLTFNTNDPVQPTVSYTLNCTGIASSTPGQSPPNDDGSDDDDDGAQSSASLSNSSELQEFDCYPWIVIVPSLEIPNANVNCLSEQGKPLPEPSPFHYLGNTAEVTIDDAGGTPVYQFRPPLKICFRYTQKELDAVDNNPAKFLIQTHYEDAWESLTTTPEEDPSPTVLGRACAPVDHLTLFAIFAGNVQNGLSTIDGSESLTGNPLSGVKYLPETGVRPIDYWSKLTSVIALVIIIIVMVGSGLLIKRSRRSK